MKKKLKKKKVLKVNKGAIKEGIVEFLKKQWRLVWQVVNCIAVWLLMSGTVKVLLGWLANGRVLTVINLVILIMLVASLFLPKDTRMKIQMTILIISIIPTIIFYFLGVVSIFAQVITGICTLSVLIETTQKKEEKKEEKK